MEDNNKRKGRKSVIDVSVVLSFAVAIFAVFSLVMADLSLSQRPKVSYAADEEDSFTFREGVSLSAVSTQRDPFVVRAYFKGGSFDSVFCTEYANQNIEDNIQYTAIAGEDGKVTDYKLLYLLSHSYANGVTFVDANSQYVLGDSDEVKETNATLVNIWITQAAIWDYLYQTYPDAPFNQIPHGEHDAYTSLLYSHEIVKKAYSGNQIISETSIFDFGENSDKTLYSEYVKPLVDSAKLAYEDLKVNVTVGRDVSLDSEKKFYFSDPVTITGEPSDKLVRYKVELEDFEGAVLVDQNGHVIEEREFPAGSDSFMVRIPADKVTKEVQTLKLKVTGYFNTLEGVYYGTSNNHQKVVSVKAGQRGINTGAEIEFYGAPDTGMTTAQTIYFIGLIVLLCGVGIVYANAKPVQVKQ